MPRAKKAPKPTIYQSRILEQIAHSPLMKTYTPEHTIYWGLVNGHPISEACANALIRNGWVKPQRDGLDLFAESQTYAVLLPPVA